MSACCNNRHSLCYLLPARIAKNERLRMAAPVSGLALVDKTKPRQLPVINDDSL